MKNLLIVIGFWITVGSNFFSHEGEGETAPFWGSIRESLGENTPSGFHTNLPVQVNKQKDHPTYLRQLALEIINDIPVDAVKVCTDGSRNDSDCTGSAIYVKTHNQEIKIQRRNPDFCSVFRSELIAVDEGLDSLASFSCSDEIWILTDSRSSIQHLANWHRARDNTGMNILIKLKSLSVSYRIHLQWIPSHVNIQGNEIADALANAGADDASVLSAPLTYLELFSKTKSRNKTVWLIHRCITGIRVLDQVAVYQLTAADATRQLLLASLVGISEVCLSLIILSVLRCAQNVLQSRPHLIIFLHAWGFPNMILFLILC
ncbi:hypothetical protein AVEN_205592-1 [Araneus ventricosus]|uniref:RNase H type-1 domain-containing protein n=1 Tax=Araneus ventricosus TaxID=182803 RepID=A0A4Y2F6B6_ARAVE|nr:hypothetical protein AVEN_205592-1 [Araneus ventricosus]